MTDLGKYKKESNGGNGTKIWYTFSADPNSKEAKALLAIRSVGVDMHKLLSDVFVEIAKENGLEF